MLDLLPSSYAGQGGTVDPATWRYYPLLEGTLEGRDGMAGARLLLSRRDAAAQVGAGASGRNRDVGGAATVDAVLETPPFAGDLPASAAGAIRFVLATERRLFATDGAPAPTALVVGTHALSLPGIAPELRLAAPARLVERPDGTATLFGVLTHATKPSKGFFLDLDLAGRVDPGHPQHPPADAPAPGAFGESADPTRWSYFAATDGKLTGFGGFKGAKISLRRHGPPARLGVGATGAGGDLGLRVVLRAKVEKPASGKSWAKKLDAELTVALDDVAITPITDPSPTKLASDPMHASMSLPGLAEDLVQLVPGRFVERSDGTARIEATLARAADPNRMLHLEAELATRIERGDPGHPPAGSPWLGLKKKAHAKKSGPAHPAYWSYFGAFDGHLSGLGAWRDLTIEMVHDGDSPQVGFGAAGESKGTGGAVPFGWAAIPPIFGTGPGGPSGTVASAGELRFRLDPDAEPVGAGLPVAYGPDCAAPGATAPGLSLHGVPGLGPVRLVMRGGPPGGTAFVYVGASRAASPAPMPMSPCLLVVGSVLGVLGPFPLDGEGGLAVDSPRPAYTAPVTLTVQGFALSAGDGLLSATRGLELTYP